MSSGIELVFKSRLNIEHWTYIFHDMNQIGYASLMGSSIGSDHQKSAVIDEVFATPEQMAESLLRNWRW